MNDHRRSNVEATSSLHRVPYISVLFPHLEMKRGKEEKKEKKRVKRLTEGIDSREFLPMQKLVEHDKRRLHVASNGNGGYRGHRGCGARCRMVVECAV